ncbi:hypothetical protein J008_02777 [Cryptococcus neoformans]|nr:hypothetical protein J008_02777 [Cryptococcus neoformans var. grubii]
MTSFFSALFFVLIAPLVFANTLQYKLHHRFVPVQVSTELAPSFNPLGHLIVSSAEDGSPFNPRIIPLNTATQVDPQEAGDSTGWYQVGLQMKEDDSDDDNAWLIATTRASYLAGPLLIKLHVEGTQLVSLSLHPLTSRSYDDSLSTVSLPQDISIFQVATMDSQKTRPPPMGTSMMVDSDTGAPVTPPPEKSFLQKYWMYILGIALFFAAQMGPEEPRNQNKGGSGK